MTIFLWIYTGYKLFPPLANSALTLHSGKFTFVVPEIVILMQQNILRMAVLPRQRSLAQLTNFPPKPILPMSMMQNQSLYHAPIVWYKEYS